MALFREGVELENSLNTQNNAEIAQLSTELRGLRERVQGVVDQGFDAAVSALMSGDEKSIDAVKRWMQLASTLGVEEEATMRYASCLRHQISLAGSQARAKLHTSDDDFSEALVHVFGAVADGFQDFLSTIGLTCTTEQSMSILRAVQEEADLQASRLLTCFEQAHTRLFQTVIVTDASVGKYDGKLLFQLIVDSSQPSLRRFPTSLAELHSSKSTHKVSAAIFWPKAMSSISRLTTPKTTASWPSQSPAGPFRG